HGIHHDHPNDKLRLVMPPAVAIPLAALFFFAFVLIFGTPAAYPLFGGFIAGYLFYDYTHYYVHHFVPRSKLGKRLREQHMRHHFQDHRYGYGVSSPTWDVIFGTLPRKRRSSGSPARGAPPWRRAIWSSQRASGSSRSAPKRSRKWATR